MLATAAVLLALFVGVEARTRSPLVPLAMFRLGQVRGANVAMVLMSAAMVGMFFVAAPVARGMDRHRDGHHRHPRMALPGRAARHARDHDRVILRGAGRGDVDGMQSILDASLPYWLQHLKTRAELGA